MAAPIDLMRKCEMCDFTCLKRVQLCIKPSGFLLLILIMDPAEIFCMNHLLEVEDMAFRIQLEEAVSSHFPLTHLGFSTSL